MHFVVLDDRIAAVKTPVNQWQHEDGGEQTADDLTRDVTVLAATLLNARPVGVHSVAVLAFADRVIAD